MALADTGRCPYINKCAFFHTEEDRQEAELHWEAWEAEWASWRQQIDQLLLRHHKLEKEIRRKVEGIIKIRMPRSSSSDLLGRCLANLGVLTRFGEQKKATTQQSSQGVGPVESGVGSVSFSAPRGRNFAEGAFVGEGMAGLADPVRTPSGPRLAESVGFCALTEAPMFGLPAASAVVGNARRFAEHSEDHAFPAEGEWLYIANSWNKEVAQQYKSGGGFLSRVETSSISTRSTLQETLAPVGKDSKAPHSSGTLVPIPEVCSKHDEKAPLPSEHGLSHGVFGQRVADPGSLHGSPYKPYSCSTLRSSSKDHEYLPLRTEDSAVRAITTAEVETGNRVVTVITSETQHTVAISTPVDTTVASRMSARESMSHEETSNYPQPLNVFVCKPLHFARSSQARAASGKPATGGALPPVQPAVDRECAETLQTTGTCRIPVNPSSLDLQAPPSCSETTGCEDERGGPLTSGGSSCRSNTVCSPQGSYQQQAMNEEGYGDRQNTVGTRGAQEVTSIKKRGQVGEFQGDSEGATPSHQQPSWAKNRNVVRLRGAQIGPVVASRSGPLGSKEPLRAADDDASVLEVAVAPQAIPFQRSISPLCAPPLGLLKNDCVPQVEPLSSVASQGSPISAVSCAPSFQSSACGERPVFDSTDGSKGSALPAEFDGSPREEMGRKYNMPNLLPLPNDSVPNSEGKAVDIPPDPAATGTAQETLEERTFGQFWNPAASAEEATVGAPLPDVSEGEAFSVAIDTVMCKTEIPFSEGCVTVSKEELNLLAGKLNHLLRTAAEEIRRLDAGAGDDLASTEGHRQNRNRMAAEGTTTTSGRMEESDVSGSHNNQEAEVLTICNVSSAGAEREGGDATVVKSNPRHHAPD